MLRGLRARLILCMVLVVVIMMATAGAFLINSVGRYQQEAFARQMREAFERNEDFVSALRQAAGAEDAPQLLKEVLVAHVGLLGIDTKQRNFYVLDSRTGVCLSGSNDEVGQTLDLSPAILSAMNGQAGYSQQITAPYLDACVPILNGDDAYLVYIKDNKEGYQTLIAELFSIVVRALLLGLCIAVLLALVLSKAITTPLEDLTKSAVHLAEGDFSQTLEVRSSDEIGHLTDTFNHMATELSDLLNQVGSERDKLETLFAHMTDGVAAFDPSGHIIQKNPASERLLARPLSPSDAFEDVFGALISREEISLLGQKQFVSKDMTVEGHILQVFFAPLGNTRNILTVIHDVSEQRRLDNLRREFVSNVSHELRTPLTNIQSYAETLLAAENLPAEKAHDFTNVILNEAERMNRIVRDLLTLSRFDYEKMDWHPTDFPLATVLNHTADALRLEAGKKRQTLTLHEGDWPRNIHADQERFTQVLMNVVENAIKYTPEGGAIDISAQAENNHVSVTVSDNGIGIPDADQSRLFERFFRVDKARARGSGGSGLGLAIAKEIMEKLGGSIEIHSKLGVGTKVTLWLPLEPGT